RPPVRPHGRWTPPRPRCPRTGRAVPPTRRRRRVGNACSQTTSTPGWPPCWGRCAPPRTGPPSARNGTAAARPPRHWESSNPPGRRHGRRIYMSSDLNTPVETTHDEPLHWEAESHAYVITGYDLAASVLRNNAEWSSDPNNVAGANLRSGTPYLHSAIVLKDAPDHTRMRSQMSPAFSSRVVERLRPRVGAIVDTVLDGLEDGDEADIVADIIADISTIVPPSVIAELFDIGVDGAELILKQSPRLVRWMELRPTPADIQSTIDAEAALAALPTPLLGERPVQPGDDFLSALVAVEGLSIDEVLTTCFIMLAAGGESTGKLIGNATLAVLRDPAQIPHLLADPARAVEELLRMEGTSKRLIRIAPDDRDLA